MVQQSVGAPGGARELEGAAERTAAAAQAATAPRAPLRPLPAPAMPAVQAYDPRYHRRALVHGLRGTGFADDDIGRIYAANWERDMSQAHPALATVAIRWKEIKMAAIEGRAGCSTRAWPRSTPRSTTASSWDAAEDQVGRGLRRLPVLRALRQPRRRADARSEQGLREHRRDQARGLPQADVRDGRRHPAVHGRRARLRQGAARARRRDRSPAPSSARTASRARRATPGPSASASCATSSRTTPIARSSRARIRTPT